MNCCIDATLKSEVLHSPKRDWALGSVLVLSGSGATVEMLGPVGLDAFGTSHPVRDLVPLLGQFDHQPIIDRLDDANRTLSSLPRQCSADVPNSHISQAARLY